MGTLSTNYALIKPAKTDLMSNFSDINSSWDTIGAVNSSRIVATLPTVGSYKVGDRVYSTADKSTYICICNDAIWGIFWRPIFKGITSWRSLGNGVMDSPSTWDATDTTRPLQVALDNQGRMYWRGVIKYLPVTNLVKGVIQTIFRVLPDGIGPRQNQTFLLGHDTLTVNTSGLSQWEGVSLSVPHATGVGASPITLTALGGNGTGDVRTVYFDGQVGWAIGAQGFRGP